MRGVLAARIDPPGDLTGRIDLLEMVASLVAIAVERQHGAAIPPQRHGADVVRELMTRTIELGHGAEYWPVLVKAIEDATEKK